MHFRNLNHREHIKENSIDYRGSRGMSWALSKVCPTKVTKTWEFWIAKLYYKNTTICLFLWFVGCCYEEIYYEF